MTCSVEMEEKTFIEASCVYNMHTGGNVFRSCYFWRFVSRFFWDRVKKLVFTLVCVSVLCISRDEATKQLLFMRSKFNFLHADI